MAEDHLRRRTRNITQEQDPIDKLIEKDISEIYVGVM